MSLVCHSVSGVVLRGSGDVRGCQSLIAYCRPLSERFGSATVNFSTSSLPLCDNPLNHIGNVSSGHKTHHRGFPVDPLHLSRQFHAKEEENAIHPETRQRLARMKWRRTSPQGSGGQPGNEPHRATDLPSSDGRLWAKTPRRDELASSHELPCPLDKTKFGDVAAISSFYPSSARTAAMHQVSCHRLMAASSMLLLSQQSRFNRYQHVPIPTAGSR